MKLHNRHVQLRLGAYQGLRVVNFGFDRWIAPQLWSFELVTKLFVEMAADGVPEDELSIRLRISDHWQYMLIYSPYNRLIDQRRELVPKSVFSHSPQPIHELVRRTRAIGSLPVSLLAYPSCSIRADEEE